MAFLLSLYDFSRKVFIPLISESFRVSVGAYRVTSVFNLPVAVIGLPYHLINVQATCLTRKAIKSLFY